MTKLTVLNLTNSPFDLEGGFRLPAMGSVTEHFSDEYAAVLRASPGVEVSDTVEPAPEPKREPAPKQEQPRKRKAS